MTGCQDFDESAQYLSTSLRYVYWRSKTMINWEELKHIHVIKKLEAILAQWFHTEIFFVDERGVVRNYDPLDRQREFKNPLCATLLPKDQGRQMVMKAIAEANEKVYRSDKQNMI